MRRAAIAVTALAFAFLGPRASVPHDRAAGEPFVYEPPEGFAESKTAAAAEEREWVHPATVAGQLAPHITLKRTRSSGTVTPADLAKIAGGMSEILEPSGVTWKEVRHETRTRPDGTRVGLIEGDCVKKAPDLLPGIAGEDLRYRRLIFVFPTDEGTAITTALYGDGEVAKWQPVFEATIPKARGVALRVPLPPNWMYFAWGAAGAVIAWLTVALVAKKKDAPT